MNHEVVSFLRSWIYRILSRSNNSGPGCPVWASHSFEKEKNAGDQWSNIAVLNATCFWCCFCLSHSCCVALFYHLFHRFVYIAPHFFHILSFLYNSFHVRLSLLCIFVFLYFQCISNAVTTYLQLGVTTYINLRKHNRK